MSHYEDICRAIGNDGAGFHEFGQGTLIKMFTHKNYRGVCHGHVVNWLIARYDGNDYVGDSEFGERKETTGLLSEHRTATVGNTSHELGGTSWDSQEEHLKQSLRTKGMTYAHGQAQSCDFLGPGSKKVTIASGVLTDTARYFYLGITGSKGGHAIGIHRPWALLGKSSKSEVFDPNFGQFNLKNSSGLQTVLTEIERIYNTKVAKSYELLPFTGNGW